MKLTNKHYFIITFIIFGFIFLHLSKQMLQIRPDGWYVGHINLYGDLVYHIALISKFTNLNTILVDSPIYAGDKINYPPLPDFATALLVPILGLDQALFWTTFLVAMLSLYLLRKLLLFLFNNEEIVLLTLVIFFLNGGLGFVYFFRDYFNSGKNIFEFISTMPNTYTQLKDIGYYWINNLLAYFLPQRSFHFAFPITLATLSLLYIGNKKNKTFYFAIAGCLSGSLPLIQAHSLLVLFMLSTFYSPISIYFANNKRKMLINWSLFAVITAVIALPVFNAISSIKNPLEFIKLDIGWTSEENLIWFWTKNLGFFLPLYVGALIYSLKQKYYLVLHLPFLGIFILANILIFQPWDFDNSKLLIYWYLSASALVSYFLYHNFLSEGVIKRIIGCFFIIVVIFSGSLEIIRTFTNVTNYQIFTNKDIEIANNVKLLTKKDDVFLTAQNHNHPIPSLTGRSTVLGFTGWVWSHGINYSHREMDIRKIYLGTSEAVKLIEKYKISHIVVGPHELNTYSINESFLNNYTSFIPSQGWKIYDVNNLRTDSNR